MFNEYIGPTRFQWTEQQLRLANQLLALLPASHRRRAGSGEPLERIERLTVEEMIAIDPTEAVDSEAIMPKLDYGGTLMQLLLNDLMHNFDTADETQAALLRMMFLFERTLVESGVLRSDFAYVVARPLPEPGA